MAESPEEPLVFHRKHFVNLFMKANLVNLEKLTVLSTDEAENVKQHYRPSLETSKTTVAIAIPEYYNLRKYNFSKRFITIEKKREFVKTLKAMYKYQFMAFVWQGIQQGKSKQKIADEWCEKLNLVDEINTKSVWRSIYRQIDLSFN